MHQSTPPKGRGATAALLLIAIFGVPAGIANLEGVQKWISQNPVLTLGLLVVYESLLVVIGLFMEVWARLRSTLVDRLIRWIDRWMVTTFSLFRRRYVKWVYYQHRDFDVKGLSTQGAYNLELEQVFVDLSIEPKPAHSTSKNPIKPIPEKLSGRQQIWSYLLSDELKDNLALIGPPGSGKTTLLKKIALHIASRRRPILNQTFPILLFLREYAASIQRNPQLSLAEALANMLARKEGPVPPEGWLEKELAAGRCLILFDGLDEVAVSDARQKVVAWVESKMKAHPSNRFLITSRPHGYRDNPISGLTVLEVQSFNRDQIRQFVHNWYRANEVKASGYIDRGVEAKAREGAADLLLRLDKAPTLLDLAVNPLLLTMISTVHRFRSSLPGRRVELYAEICEVFLGKRAQARGIDADLTPLQKQRVLQPLAFHLTRERKREIPAGEAEEIISEPLRRVVRSKGQRSEEKFIKDIEEGSGIVLERESQIYSFAHLVFQEYLAAVHAKEQGLGEEIIENVADPWWHETLRLYGAQGDASQIMAACLSAPQPTTAALTLAIDCLEEAREVDPEWRAKIDSLLYQSLEDQDPDRFRIAAETLLTRRLRDMVPLTEEVWIDSSLVTNAEYQLFVDESRATDSYYHPDSWSSLRFLSGQALSPVLGIRYSDAKEFCSWLSERDSLFYFRLPTAREIVGLPNSLDNGPPRGCWLGGSKLGEFHWFNRGEPSLSKDYLENLRHDDLVLARAVDHAYSLALALESALALLAKSRERLGDIQAARNMAQKLAQVLDIERIIDINAAREIADALYRFKGSVVIVNDFAQANRLARSLAAHLRHALAQPLDRLFVTDIEEAREQTINYVRGMGIRDRGLKLALAIDRDRQRKFEAARRLKIDQVDGARVLDLDRSIRLRRARNEIGHAETMSVIHWHARISALLGQDPKLYHDLALLEARIKGLAPAVEGILLVKERRTKWYGVNRALS